MAGSGLGPDRVARWHNIGAMCVVVLFSGSHVVTAALAGQAGTRWNVPADVTAADRRDILQLAGQLKIHDPELVRPSTRAASPYGSCPGRSSTAIVFFRNGILIRRASGAGCGPVASGQPVKRVGNWLTGAARRDGPSSDGGCATGVGTSMCISARTCRRRCGERRSGDPAAGPHRSTQLGQIERLPSQRLTRRLSQASSDLTRGSEHHCRRHARTRCGLARGVKVTPGSHRRRPGRGASLRQWMTDSHLPIFSEPRRHPARRRDVVIQRYPAACRGHGQGTHRGRELAMGAVGGSFKPGCTGGSAPSFPLWRLCTLTRCIWKSTIHRSARRSDEKPVRLYHAGSSGRRRLVLPST